MGFSRQEYWSGLPSPSPGGPSEPGIEPEAPESPALAGRFFTTEPQPAPDPKQSQQFECWEHLDYLLI